MERMIAAAELPSFTANSLQPVGCPVGCKRRRVPRVEKRILLPKFELANGGRWLAPLTCVGPSANKRAAAGATRPFTTAAHIRSVRYDFERPPKRLKKDRRRAGSDISLDASAPTYDAGRNRYLGTNHLPGGISRGPAANPRSLVHTEEGIRTVRLVRRRAPRRRRIGPPK